MSSGLDIDSRSLVHLALAVDYVSEYGEHRDVRHFEKFNLWRDMDLLPAAMQNQLMGQQAGYRENFNFSPGELTGPLADAAVHSMASRDFNREPRKNLQLEPRMGRFYPRGWFRGIPGNFSDDMRPARLVNIDDECISVDTGHALADYALNISVEVFDVSPGGDEHGGRCNDSIADLLDGPGMNLRYRRQPTDFFADDPCARSDDSLDGLFYSMPRLVDHIDAHARQQLRDLYKRLLPEAASLLDLMSSMNSHLPDELQTEQVVGLGMNQKELEANDRLQQRFIHDLNDDPLLPFDDASFDAIICSLSVEYLTRPFNIFREAGRVLKPGGVFINSFSNRWFPTKAINIWGMLHEFERMGLVTEYFIQSGQFRRINSHSVRGLSRPLDDRHALPLSDPVYAVWGIK